MISDKIADLCVRINNGYRSKLLRIFVSYSIINVKILKLLYREGFINGYYFCKFNNNNCIGVYLKYFRNTYALKFYKRISKPGRHLYFTVNKLKQYFNKKTLVILSTSYGIISHRYAIYKNVGGEVLFIIN